jgi:hypothetical protein
MEALGFYFMVPWNSSFYESRVNYNSLGFRTIHCLVTTPGDARRALRHVSTATAI